MERTSPLAIIRVLGHVFGVIERMLLSLMRRERKRIRVHERSCSILIHVLQQILIKVVVCHGRGHREMLTPYPSKVTT